MAASGGSLITARLAADQGRMVLPCPEELTSSASGCNQLIRDGATLIRNANDVIEEIEPTLTEIDNSGELPECRKSFLPKKKP